MAAWLAGSEEAVATVVLGVEGFRGVVEAEVELAPLTLVTGRNDSGKSSLLEAFALAMAAPGLRDWLGRDVARVLVEGKLGGRPLWLVRDGFRAALVELRGAGRGARLLLKRVDGREASRLVGDVACRALRGMSALGLGFCLLAASERAGRREAANLTRLVGVLEERIRRLAEECGGDEVLEPLRGLVFEAARLVVEESVLARVEVPGGVHERLLPPVGRRLRVLRRRLRSLLPRGPARELVQGLLGLLGYRGSVEHRLAGEVADCVVSEAVAAVLDALEAVWSGDGEAGRAPVLPLFQRLLYRRDVVEALVEAVRRLHEAGLLQVYNRLLSEAGLGLSDPMIDEGMVWLRRGGERVPAALLGDGTLNMLLLLAGLAAVRQGVVLIVEEPETALHPGYMEALARVMVEAVRGAARRGGAVVASTHSLELIDAVARRAEEEEAEPLLRTVLMHGGMVHSVFEGAEVVEAMQLRLDLRGL